MTDHQNKLSKFWQELKRRKVIRVTIVYATTAFIVLQLVDMLLEPLGLPQWVMTFFVVLLLVGFPIAVIFSWIFDVTPQGIEVTRSTDTKVKNESTGIFSKRYLGFDIVIGVLLIVVAVLAYPKIFKDRNILSGNELRKNVSIAVLPFENYTGNSALDFWQQGIAEYLLNSLGSSKELTVINSHVVSDVLESFKNKNSSPISASISQEVAKLLNVSIYVTGNYIGRDNDKSIMVNLSKTGTGEVIWSDKVDGDLNQNYRDLLNNVAASVRNYLELKILENKVPVEYTNAYPKSAEAYKSYIEGLNFILACDFNSAIPHLQKAIEMDSTFAFASFYLSWAYSNNNQWEEANYWIKRTYEKIQNLPFQYQPWINLWYLCYFTKDKREIVNNLKQLEKSTSKSRFLWYDIGTTYYSFLEEYQKAIDAFQKVDEISSELGEEWIYDDFYAVYSHVFLLMDRPKDAINIAQRGMALKENSNAMFWYYCAYVMLKDSAKIKEAFNKIESFIRSESNQEQTKYLLLLNGRDTLNAEIHARRSYELDSDNPVKIFSLASVLIRGGININEGLDMVNKLLIKDPEDVSYLWLKGIALFKNGNNAEALDTLNMAWEKLDGYSSKLDDDIYKVKQAIEKEKKKAVM